jgi:predicted N-acyltransferase
MKSLFTTIVAVSCAVILFAGGIALAQTNWMDELSSSVNFYKNRYPVTNNEPANWDTYLNELNFMKKAAIRGDREAVRVGMAKWFKMLKEREGGINPKAADELFRMAVLATPKLWQVEGLRRRTCAND